MIGGRIKQTIEEETAPAMSRNCKKSGIIVETKVTATTIMDLSTSILAFLLWLEAFLKKG
jgi:hypothetical protein